MGWTEVVAASIGPIAPNAAFHVLDCLSCLLGGFPLPRAVLVQTRELKTTDEPQLSKYASLNIYMTPNLSQSVQLIDIMS